MRYRYAWRGVETGIEIDRHGSGYRAIIGGKSYDFEILHEQPGMISLRFEGRPVTLYWAAAPASGSQPEAGGKKWVSLDGCTYLLERPRPKGASRGGDGPGSGSVRSPMPAQVRSVEVFEGEAVKKGQTLMILEAMKMEIRIQAPFTGRVVKLHAGPGEGVEREEVLCEVDEGTSDQ